MTVTFLEDLKIKNLYPIKLLLFLQAAGDMALYPFLTLHMKSLGISITEIGIQFAISPLACLIATPLVGLVADKIGNYKIMLFGSLLLAALVGNLLLFVPPIQTVSKCEKTQEQLQISCSWNSTQLIDFIEIPSRETEDEPDNYAVFDIPKCFEKLQEKKNKFGSNPLQHKKASQIFNPTLTNCQVKCKETEKSKNIKWKGTVQEKPSEYRGPGFCLVSEQFNHENCFQLNNSSSKNQMQFDINLSMSGLPISKQYHGVILSINRKPQLTDKLVKNKTIVNYQKINCVGASKDDCSIFCPIKKNIIIPNMQQSKIVDSKSHMVTFWSYLFLRVLMVIIIATEMSLLKAAVLTIVNGNNSEYGYQRVWASYAVCIIPMVTGIIMDKLILNGSTQTFSPCFYLFSGLKVLMAFIAISLSLDLSAPSAAIFSKLNELARRPEVSIFLFYAAFIGSIWGFIETFIVWYMEDLGASRTLIGFSFSLSALSGIPFNIFAGFFERKIGHVPILIFTMFVFAFRLIGYSFSSNSYHVLFFEAFDGFTSTLSIVILTTYANKLSSTDLLATMQAAWAVLYFSVGRALGTVIGGFLMDNLGFRLAYQAFAFTTIIGALIYILIYKFYLREIIKERDDLEKKCMPKINYKSNLNTAENNVEKKEGLKNGGIDHNSNVSNQNNLNSNHEKPDENIVYKSGRDNLAFRIE